MIDSEVEQMKSEFENRLRMQGMNLELYYQFSGQDEGALKQQLRGDAEKRVRNNLVLDAIAKAARQGSRLNMYFFLCTMAPTNCLRLFGAKRASTPQNKTYSPLASRSKWS